ncbi:hypothetical protein [Natrarchaeobius halalkaliphilus]|nr:hypothetical protein [Natrarchaeobius halalkaliphilus]
MTLTVAMLGSLMFMGFAGTAAASNHDVDQETGDATVTIETAQQNNNAQVGIAESSSSSFSFGSAASDSKYGNTIGASSYSSSNAEVNQVQVGSQSNSANIENVGAESGDNVNFNFGGFNG